MAPRQHPRKGRSRRGFAAMDPEERREISSRGGKASHLSGRGHEFSSEEAREAGRRGGEARWRGHGSRSAELEDSGGSPGALTPGTSGSRSHFEEEGRGGERNEVLRSGDA